MGQLLAKRREDSTSSSQRRIDTTSEELTAWSDDCARSTSALADTAELEPAE